MSASQCFYPNGDPSKENDVPCGSGGGVQCCPSGWACQINGLCYLANQKYYGRYTCTDRSWKSPGCPQICTHNNTANGNEAVLECTPGSFCCDTNRPELSGGQACCDSSPARFSLNGNIAITAMSEAPASATATAQSNTTPDTSSSIPNQSNSAQVTSVSLMSPSTDSLGRTSIVVVTSVFNQNGVVSVTSVPITNDTNSHPANIGGIVGGAVAGLIALIGIAVLAFLLLRRRRQRKPPQILRDFSQKKNLDSMYKDRRSLKPPYRSDAPSELVGSVPDLNAPNGEISEREWEKRYENPGDVGKFKLRASQHGAFDPSKRSSVKHQSPNAPSEPVELSAEENANNTTSLGQLSELSESHRMKE